MRRIKKVAVLGSGLMGSGIACHLANIGLEVLLLDLPGLAQPALQKAAKSKPAPLYEASFLSRIATGSFDDDLPKIKDCDWVIEAIVENLDIKRQLFEKVDALRKPGALISSNTSGIPIHLMAQGRSDDFRRHFCGTHFFNPPRYLRLLEIIPTPDTDPAIVSFFMDFGDRYLGKQTVHCKDTPGFVANRIGIFTTMNAFELTSKLGLRIEEVDRLTGPALARPKTGTFRLADLIGLDTAHKVSQDLQKHCPDDQAVQKVQIPAWLSFLLENGFLGNKSGQGFYKKAGHKEFHVLNLDTLAYEPSQKVSMPSLEAAKQIDDPAKRIRALFDSADKGGQFVRQLLLNLFSYVSHRIPEIADDLFAIDDAMRAGFAWEFGPFEYWDVIGLDKGIREAESLGLPIASWVKDMQGKGVSSFYKNENGRRLFYHIPSGAYQPVDSLQNIILLDPLRTLPPVHTTSETVLHDIGDGVLCLEFTSKMNAIGEGILRGLNDAVRIAEEGEWKGLVIGNNAQNFTVGANLMMIAMMAYNQEYDELNMAVNLFQQTTMRARYSSVPVVIATQGYVFGGGCELLMHCDAAVCAAESYIGLVEAGVGLLPGAGGTKEFAVRASDSFREGEVLIPALIERFRTIATAQVATSAQEGYKLGYLQSHKDFVEVNTLRNIATAKEKVLQLAENYVQPIPRQDVQVLGRTGLAALYVAANELKLGHFASEHDIKIARKTAYVLCGGDLTGSQLVSEQYLLDIEREAFLSLCAEPKTLERIQHMLQTGKPLRN